LMNAFLIDVFEASKVAEPLWLLLGIGVGAAKLHQKKPINYKKEITGFFTSHIMIMIYFLALIATVFVSSMTNFFVASDFTWLRWAATTTTSQLPQYFLQSQDLFYRPLDKTIIYLLYSVFSFQPEGYHIFILFIHFLVVGGVYFLAQRLTHSKLLGVLTAVIFALHPAHAENVFWFSSFSVALCALFIMYAMVAFLCFRDKKSTLSYVIAVVLSVLAFLSYEQAIIIPLLLLSLDIFITKQKRNLKLLLTHLPFLIVVIIYVILRSLSHAFIGSENYGYYITSMVPNIFGNVFGYTGIFFGGLPFLTFYTLLREGLRSEWIYFTIVVSIFIGYVAWSMYIYKNVVRSVLQKSETSLILFGLVFALLSLLPFLPLGTITPHYLYLASFGYAFALIVALQLFIKRWVKNKKYATLILIAIVIALSGVYYLNNRHQQQKWQKSGELTKNTLVFFRRKYPGFTKKTDIYFVNTPVKYENVWVFPTGLADGLWFIYRDNMPQFYQFDTVEDAMTAVNKKNNMDSHVFEFTDEGKLQESR